MAPRSAKTTRPSAPTKTTIERGGPRAADYARHLDEVERRHAKHLGRVRRMCLALPETTEQVAWGHPTFRAGKRMFAAIGVEDGRPQLTLPMGGPKQAEMLDDPRTYLPPYVGGKGWIGLYLDKKWTDKELVTLIEHGYRQVALKRMLSALDDPDS